MKIFSERLGQRIRNALPFLFGFILSANIEAAAPTAGLAIGGTSAHVKIDPALSLADRSFTVEAWVWFDDLSGVKPILAQIGPDNLLHLLVRNGSPWLGFWADDLEGATTLQTGRWYHLSYWFDASTLEQRIYVDGALDGSRTASGPAKPDRGRLYVGEYGQRGLHSFDGRLLELRIWDHPRDPQALAADRFTTPSPTAPGLLALYTFEGDLSGSVPDATGTFTQNALVGGTQVSPVRPPSDLGGVIESVPASSLADYLSGYTYETTPDASYPDSTGTELTDGVAPPYGWGLPWGEGTPTAAEMGALVGWKNQPAKVTLTFDGFVNLQSLSLFAMDSDGADGVHLPYSVELRTPGGFVGTFPISNPSGSGLLTEIALTNLDLLTDAVTVEARSPAGWIMLGEVTADGTPPGPAPASDGDDLSLPAQLFLGLDPAQTDAFKAHFRVIRETTHFDFRFPVAADPYGVEPIAQWSPDLNQWFSLPFQVDAGSSEAFARLEPPPAEGRAFFRLHFPEPAFSDSGPRSYAFNEDDAPFTQPAGNLLRGLFVTGRNRASLHISALGDQPSLLGTPLRTASGGTVTVNADGSFSYTVPESLTEGQVFNEALTFTVADRLGNSHRRTASFAIVGQNDAPVADDDTLDVTEAAETPTLNYSYYHITSGGSVAEVVNGTPVATGTSFGFDLNNRDRNDFFGFAFEGTINIPVAGDWTFYTVSDDSSTLHIGDTLVVDNQGLQAPTERSGTVNLTAGLHHITVRFAKDQGGQFLAVLWEGPGTPKAPIPVSALQPTTDPTLAVPALLANDNDPDTGETTQLVVSALNGNAANVGQPISLPTGTLTIEADGTGTFTPNNSVPGGVTAQESIAYTIEDPHGATATGTLTINVTGTNDAPAPLDPSFTFSGNESQPVALTQLASDPDTGDTLTIIALNGTSVTAPETIPTANGQLALLADGSVTYTPGEPAQALADGETLTETFTYTVADAAGATATGAATLTIEGVNDAPSAPGLIAHIFNLPHRFQPRVLNFSGLSYVSDPETPRDQLRVTSVLGDPANVGQPVTLPSGVIVTIEENGNVTFDENNSLVGGNPGCPIVTDTPEWVSVVGADPGRYRTVKVDNYVRVGNSSDMQDPMLQLTLHITETAPANPGTGGGQRWSIKPPAGFIPEVDISRYGYFLGPAPDFPLGYQADVRIPFNATPAEVEAALEAWPEIEDVQVSGDLMSGTLEVEMVQPSDLGAAPLRQLHPVPLERRGASGSNWDQLLYPFPEVSMIIPFTVADPEGQTADVFLRGDLSIGFLREDVLDVVNTHSTFEKSFTRVTNRYAEPVEIVIAAAGTSTTMSLPASAESDFAVNFNDQVQIFLKNREVSNYRADAPLEAAFRDNIVIVPVGQSQPDVFRYDITNNNSEDITLRIREISEGSTEHLVNVPANSTVQFENDSVHGIHVFIHDFSRGTFLPVLTPLFAQVEVVGSFFSGSNLFVSVRNNSENATAEVKIQSTDILTIEDGFLSIDPQMRMTFLLDTTFLPSGSSFNVIFRDPSGAETVLFEFTPAWP